MDQDKREVHNLIKKGKEDAVRYVEEVFDDI